MDLTVLRYIVLIVAVIILIWAIFELRSRQVHRKKLDDGALGAWVKLDSTKVHLEEEPLSLAEEEKDKPEEQTEESDIHTRAQQNGHYIPSKKTL